MYSVVLLLMGSFGFPLSLKPISKQIKITDSGDVTNLENENYNKDLDLLSGLGEEMCASFLWEEMKWRK